MSRIGYSSIYVPYSEKIGTHFFAKNFFEITIFFIFGFCLGKELRERGG
jgi:glycopeptide antibiotics resistance protein